MASQFDSGLTMNQLAERNAVLVSEVEKLRAERDQLAGENVVLRDAVTEHSQSVHFCEVCGKDDPCSTDDVCYVLKETPATEAYLAGIKADGVEEFVSNTTHKIFDESDAVSALAYLSLANAYVKQLREGAK